MGTKFTVFDNALNPERALPDMSNARQELAGIIYVSSSQTIYVHEKTALFDSKTRAIQFKNPDFTSFLAPGNKCFGDEGAQEDDGYHSRNEQGQRASASQTKKCKIRFFSFTLRSFL